MKKVICALLAVVFCVGAAGCGGAEKAPFQPAQTAKAVVNSGAFSGEMIEFDHEVLFQLPGEAADYEGSVVYYNTTGTAEVVAVIQTGDEAGAKEAEKTLQDWVDSAKRMEGNYRPGEADKLEDAILERRGNTVLLVVPADAAKAKQAIG